ncbi:GIY-YIG nuclease family protein [Streptomyces sp. NPDC056323]|uniref:GIY-YIG nuclease family protein n=1 Tax=Streptomyces sp. NPDC056323 TaxID=3345784 RepID=UPI0035DF0D4C
MTGSIDPRRLTAVYRLYDTDWQLLYVGSSVHPQQRWERHASTKLWWSAVKHAIVEWLPDREAALSVERDAITAGGPLYNDKATEKEAVFPYQGNRGPTRETLLRRAMSDYRKAADRLAIAVDRADLDGLSNEEIAAIVGESVDTIKNLVKRRIAGGGLHLPR